MDILDMSDEDIANMVAPPAKAGGTDDKPNPNDGGTTPADDTTVQEVTNDDTTSTTQDDDDDGGKSPEEVAAEANKKDESDGAAVEEPDPAKADPSKKPEEKDGLKPDGKNATKVEEGNKPETTPDYKAFYEAALAPLKANGKVFEIKSPEDLRALAEQGLNYTKKMQQIAPIRKIGMMLQNHGLLDETKLSFLIDLHNRDPEAIRKLIKEAGIDPLQIDTTSEPQYKQSNHAVPDDEVNFRTVMQDLQGSDDGQNTLQVINTTWDAPSKQALWENPNIMKVVNEHRANGVYDRVATEVERLRALGQIADNVPFLQAYQYIGTEMGKQGLLNDLLKTTPTPQSNGSTQPAPKQPIATRTVAKKPDTNAAKVAAAAQTNSGGKPSIQKINPLEMSDADFEAELKKSRGYT